MNALSQHQKNRAAPVCEETPGQHWPDSWSSRHLKWNLQSASVVGDTEGIHVGLTGYPPYTEDLDVLAAGLRDGLDELVLAAAGRADS